MKSYLTVEDCARCFMYGGLAILALLILSVAWKIILTLLIIIVCLILLGAAIEIGVESIKDKIIDLWYD